MAGSWGLKVPPGVVPKNLPVYAALGIAAVLILVMLLTGSGVPPDESAVAGGEEAMEAVVADVRGVVAPVLREGERLREDLARLEEQRRAEAAAREQEQERAREESMRDARRELEAARTALLETQRIRERADAAGVPPGDVAGDIRDTLETVEERELREVMRLEELQRFAASLRAPAVVGDSGPAPPARAQDPLPVALTGDPALDESLRALVRSEAGGLGSRARASAERQTAPGMVEPAAPGVELSSVGDAPSSVGSAAEAVSLTESYVPGPDLRVSDSSGRGSAAVVRWPDVPEGLDLVYEGRMMQAVLETRLAGDFTGPARARLTVAVRTPDRTRVVIPRGTLALGRAQAVDSGFQSRLAVTFNRLRFPDGRSVRMGFEGLSALGETGLADEVNRHYLSTIGAVGAVGLLAGLSAGGGAEGYFDPARQQFSVAAIRFLDRFMNRLPEIRVRAGHPVRIYLTQDLLVPRG